MIIDRTGYDEAIAALEERASVSTRDCVAITLATGEVKRFVIDTAPLTFDGNQYVEVAAAEVQPISLGSGQLADSTTIHLDGSQFTETSGKGMDGLLIELMRTPLRDRPIQISTMVLDEMTAEPIGLIPIFAGFIDQSSLDRSRREEGSVWTLSAASYRAYAQRRPERVIAHNDHIQRWPGDTLLKFLADTIFTSGVARWNTTNGESTGTADRL